MKALSNRSGGNFYEAFSDLIFCTLVLFVVLFVVLVLQLETRIEAVQESEQAVEESQKEIEARVEELKQTEQALESRVTELQTMETDLQTQITQASERQQHLDNLIGTNRFTGSADRPSFYTAVDLDTLDTRAQSIVDVKWFFVPANLIDRWKTNIFDESAEEKRQRKKTAAEEFAELSSVLRAYTAKQASAIVACAPSLTSRPVKPPQVLFGFEPTSKGTVVGLWPNMPAIHADLRVGDVITHVDDQPFELTLLQSPTEKKEYQFWVRRKQETLTIALTPDETSVAWYRIVPGAYTGGANDWLLSGFAGPDGELQLPDNGAALDELRTDAQRAFYASTSSIYAENTGQVEPRFGSPTMILQLNADTRTVSTNGVDLSPQDLVDIIASKSGGSLALEFTGVDASGLPSWVVEEILIPSGCTNRVAGATVFDSQ